MLDNVIDKMLNFIAKNLFRSDFLITERVQEKTPIPAQGEVEVEISPPTKANYKCIGIAGWSTWHYAVYVGQIQRLDNGNYKVVLKSTSGGTNNSAIVLDLLYFRVGS